MKNHENNNNTICTNDSVEYSTLFGSTADNGYVKGGYTKGVSGRVDLDVNYTTSGIIHTHDIKSSSMFSYTDFEAMITIDKNGLIPDYNDFFFGVISNGGDNAYMLVIDDVNKYNKWKDTVYNAKIEAETTGNIENQRDLEREYYHNGVDGKDLGMNEMGILQYFRDRETGLRLFKSENNNFTKWSEILLNVGGWVLNRDCY